ncbi:Crp/Fnr family transcriptional regulator [Lichenibacterium dinghuense]|uniref:Crp/Fnr family transcriptional regulator n=1 Tax=Lichenibacterium dinghuense TaxID=2895977 RepID=UPI001F2107F3|nr:Crp/Fnr family transcriptional regulator [Lichenibacterium sp. 6Y81]
MALFQSSIVHNRLLSVLSRSDFALLEPKLERVPMILHTVLIQPHQPIPHVYFPESGISSMVADTAEGRIEVGLVGHEGLVGFPVIQGADRTPHAAVVQGAGEALRISTQDLRAAIQTSPSILLPLLLFTHTLIVQMGQTTYMNLTFNIEARLARWILMTQDRTGDNEVLLTHEFLAAMLGVRRPSVTSATHALEGMGSIRNKRGRIEVRNRAKLVELAGDAYQVAEDEHERVIGSLVTKTP